MNIFIRKPGRAIIALRVLFLALITVNLTFIWMNSAKISTESTKSSRKIAESITKQVVKDYDTLSKTEQKTHVAKMNTRIRSMAHFAEFIPLGMLFCFLGLSIFDVNNGKRRSLLIAYVMFALIMSLLCALGDEVHQIFVKGRSFEIKDIVTDTLGSLCGSVSALPIYSLFFNFLQKHRKIVISKY